MKFKSIVIAGGFAAAVAGCASRSGLIDQVMTLNQPYRVIEHDFSDKYGLVYSLPKTIDDNSIAYTSFTDEKRPEAVTAAQDNVDVEHEPLSKGKNTSTPKPTLRFIDIDFYNESAVIKDREALIDDIKSNLDSDKYLIVGHSHGKSSIGVETLAAQRVRYISNALFLAGIPRDNLIFVTSFSDGGGNNYDIPKGARIFALKDIDETMALITGLSLKEAI